MNLLKGFFDMLQDNLVQSHQKLGTFLLNRFFQKWIKLKMMLIKIVVLIWYSNKKIIFMKFKLCFGPKNWLWILKMPNFWRPCTKLSCKISKNPLRRFTLDIKVYWISLATLWNSKTVIMLMYKTTPPKALLYFLDMQ